MEFDRLGAFVPLFPRENSFYLYRFFFFSGILIMLEFIFYFILVLIRSHSAFLIPDILDEDIEAGSFPALPVAT